jgi:predicted MFS family arabinose efflux permease
VTNTSSTLRGSIVVVTLGLLQILAWGSSFYLLSVLALPIAADTGWPMAAVVGALSVALLAAGLVSPRVGDAIQSYGGRPVLASSSVCFAAGLLTVGLAPNLPVYFLGWLLIGLGMGTGLYDPTFAALGRQYGSKARRMITTVTLFGGFASTVCWPVSAVLLEMGGWRMACISYAAAHLIVAMPAYLALLPKSVPRSHAAAAETDELARALPTEKRRAVLPVVAAVMTISAAALSLISAHLLTLLQLRGLDLLAAVALGALIGPSQVAARIVELAFGRHYHPLWTMLVGTGLVAAGLILLSANVPAIALALVAYGAGNGLSSIVRGTVPLALFGSEQFAALMGRLGLPVLLAMAIAPTLGALLIDADRAQLLFTLLTLLALINVGLAMSLALRFGR